MAVGVGADQTDVFGVEGALFLDGGFDGMGGWEERSVDVGEALDDDGSFAEGPVGSEVLDVGLEEVEVAGVEGEEDVALEGGRGVGVEWGEVEKDAGVAVEDGVVGDLGMEVGGEVIEGERSGGAGAGLDQVAAAVVGEGGDFLDSLCVEVVFVL